jgi:hypothetical protein
MPHCEECKVEVKPEQLHEEAGTGTLLCEGCAEGKVLVKLPNKKDLILGRDYEYDVSLSKDGFSARGRLGGFRAAVHVDSEELAKVFGIAGK